MKPKYEHFEELYRVCSTHSPYNVPTGWVAIFPLSNTKDVAVIDPRSIPRLKGGMCGQCQLKQEKQTHKKLRGLGYA